MPRRCTLMTLAIPQRTERRSFPPHAPIVSLRDSRVAVALRELGFTTTTTTVVGDGEYAAYADVHAVHRDRVALGTLLAGPFQPCRRVFALALARDIVTRATGAPCTATAICCEAGGVRSVPVPDNYLAIAKTMLL